MQKGGGQPSKQQERQGRARSKGRLDRPFEGLQIQRMWDHPSSCWERTRAPASKRQSRQQEAPGSRNNIGKSETNCMNSACLTRERPRPRPRQRQRQRPSIPSQSTIFAQLVGLPQPKPFQSETRQPFAVFHSELQFRPPRLGPFRPTANPILDADTLPAEQAERAPRAKSEYIPKLGGKLRGIHGKAREDIAGHSVTHKHAVQRDVTTEAAQGAITSYGLMPVTHKLGGVWVNPLLPEAVSLRGDRGPFEP